MAYCANCGSMLKENSRYCSMCGVSTISQTGLTVGQQVDKVVNYLEKSTPQVKKQLSNKYNRHISPVLFALALFSLFLPFVTLSCEGVEIVTLTGFDLATGVDFGYGQRSDGNMWAIIFIIVMIGGLGICFWQNEKSPRYILGSASVSFLFLMITLADMGSEVSGQGNMGFGFSYQFRYGFNFIILFILAIIGYNAYFLYKKPPESLTESDPKIITSPPTNIQEQPREELKDIGQDQEKIQKDEINSFFNENMSTEEVEEYIKHVTIPWFGGNYTGQVKDGKPDGQGKIIIPEKAEYAGEWKDGKPDGFGNMKYAGGATYVGEFASGTRHGQGTYTYSDGRELKGEWENGKYKK